MLGNFSYSNPTKLYFGEDSLEFLGEELENYGENVMLCYGGGSIKKNGIYEKVISILKAAGKNIFEDGGVMPNPTVDKLYEGCRIAKENKVDLILAVGGGSVCDYAKAVSVSAYCESDPWEKYYLRMEDVDNEIIPIGCVLTMVGTGSEMNGGAVITNPEQKLKIGHVFGDNVFPKFAILNPTFTYTLPKYQMVAGIYDIFNHITEQYFSGEDDNTSALWPERIDEISYPRSRIALNPTGMKARSNDHVDCKTFPAPEQAAVRVYLYKVLNPFCVACVVDATHGMTLSAVSMPYYEFIMPYGLKKFARFAVNVWEVNPAGKTEEQVAAEGLKAMELWIKELGLVTNLSEIGVKEEMLDDIVNGVFIMEGGYKLLSKEEVREILVKAM